MRFRGLFLADGPSDLPLSDHVAGLCRRQGLDVDLTAVPGDRLPPGTGRTVEDRVRAVFGDDPDFAFVVVHRDAEGQDPARRHAEVHEGVDQAGFGGPAMAVVPVRMTEAWLLLDEAAIRAVAGRPRGGPALNLPTPAEAERVADPKAPLREVLEAAAAARGRRLKTFRRQFGEQRRLLLERLDPDGPVTALRSWQELEHEVRRLVALLSGAVAEEGGR